MGAAAAPIIGGLGLVQGILGNNDQANQANAANRRANNLAGLQTDWFKRLSDIVQKADAGGQFNPDQQIAQLGRDTAYQSGLDQTNQAGAARVLGYKPGDTAPLQQQQAITDSYKLRYGDMANQIRQNAFRDKLNAYGAVNPSQLNAPEQVYANQANSAMSRVQSPTGFLSSLSPYLLPPQTQTPVFGGPPAGGGNGNPFPLQRW